MNNFIGSYRALNNSLYGNYRTRKFTDIYDNVDAFLADYSDNGLPMLVDTTNMTTLFYLLYAKINIIVNINK